MTKLLVLEEKSVFERYASPELYSECDITVLNQFSDVETIAAQAPDAEVLLVNPTISVGRELIERLPCLKLIQAEGVGYEGIPLRLTQERGIYVCNCRGVNAAAVAEHTVMLMLCCLRDVIGGNEDVLSGRQNEKKVYYMRSGALRELGDCTVGFIGYGAIGKEAARLTRAFGAKTLYFKPHRADEEYAEYCDLEAVSGALQRGDAFRERYRQPEPASD